MEHFLVSARKYRPQDFASVVGQSHITTTLKNAILQKQLAHAFLFCGPRGVGKTTCARILAKTINCENLRPDGEACNQCASCVAFNQGTSFNIHELDAASNNSVDDIRALVDQVRFPPQGARYKTYIIDEVHMLSTAAFNAFLKTLEEPPSYAIFILATTEKHKILPTILSRCQVFDFRRITLHDIVHHLQEICAKEQVKAEEEALHLIAQKSEGCMRDALSIFDTLVSFTGGNISYQQALAHLNMLNVEYYFRLMESIHQQDIAQTLLCLDEILQKGFDGENVLEGMAEFLRDLMVCRDEKLTALLDIAPNFRKRYAEMAQRCSLSWLVSALALLQDAEVQYRNSRNKRLALEIAFIKLCYLQQAVQLVSDVATGEVVKKKLIHEGESTRLRAPFQAVPKPMTIPKPASVSSASPSVKGNTNPSISSVTPSVRPAMTEFSMTASGKLPTLDVLKKDRQTSRQPTDTVQAPLALQQLQQCWDHYIALLQEKGQHALAAQLAHARIAVIPPEEIQVTTWNIVQFRFLEDERIHIAEYLKEKLARPGLVMKILLEEQETPADTQSVLTPQQQFEQLKTHYPLIARLQDELDLEVDY
ncbi:DNA polymerase-3 subunit gamma/tau [Thermoflavifilum aggregans]|uniref:DNA polymerase III subunit gamma/tau n=1 Tax=Thermoflavifilum aggregans TaxID=454188 RepID=A0A2M9CSP4_9BACT|nr:DNA polymerase III subunit gamma/tau [Thermoflavifilum aggregans]PJJ74828.1 DNA polymerase-3 subunit gamma/tau [Thermoflavifilum aggregans]